MATPPINVKAKTIPSDAVDLREGCPGSQKSTHASTVLIEQISADRGRSIRTLAIVGHLCFGRCRAIRAEQGVHLDDFHVLS